MKYMNPVHIFALLVVLIFSAGLSFAAPDLKSAKPRYAKIIISKDTAKAISVIFDESKGTGKGYDTIYVDSNMNGEFEQAEKMASDFAGSEGVYSNNMFPVINLPSLTINGKSKSDIVFQCIKFYDKEEIFAVRVMSVKYVNNKAYEYLFYGDLNPSIDINNPFLWNIGQVPSVKLDVKPDAANTGIALSFNVGDAEVFSQNIIVNLTIRNASGKVIKKETGNLDKFAFG